MSDASVGTVMALYLSSVYLLSLPGGWIADRFLGQRKAVTVGGIGIMLGNAMLKLEHARAMLKESAVRPLPQALAADDSGLAVALLGGEPGVHSARCAERAGSGSGDAANRQELAHRLREAGLGPGEKVPAAFACAIAFLELETERALETMSECPGVVGLDERGEGGFGYDGMFFPVLEDGRLSDLTFAQLPSATKHSLSHRGLALKALVAKLGEDR